MAQPPPQQPPPSPDSPLLTNLLKRGGQALVELLETPLVAEAEVLRKQQRAEAELNSSVPPWQTLAEQHSILEDELKVRILRIADSEENFTAQLAERGQLRRPGNILPGCLPMANAALEEDEPLRALRFKMVPARLSEEYFWRCYFWHVANVKCDLLHDWRTANGAKREAILDDEATLAPLADAASPPRGGAAAGGSETGGVAAAGAADGATADDLDAEFERLVAAPTP
jgi:hypothetical protein